MKSLASGTCGVHVYIWRKLSFRKLRSLEKKKNANNLTPKLLHCDFSYHRICSITKKERKCIHLIIFVRFF